VPIRDARHDGQTSQKEYQLETVLTVSRTFGLAAIRPLRGGVTEHRGARQRETKNLGGDERLLTNAGGVSRVSERPYSDLERSRLCHTLRAPAMPAAAPRSAIVAGSGTRCIGTESFLSLSTFGDFSVLGFPGFPFP
jgi:hypothetical protein